MLRLKGAYFTVSSLLLAVVMQLIFTNLGLRGIEYGSLVEAPAGQHRSEQGDLLRGDAHPGRCDITLVVRYVERSKFGAGLVAIRDDEDVAKTMGINTPWLKIKAFILGAFLAGTVGGIYGYYMSYVHPEVTFSMNTSLLSC